MPIPFTAAQMKAWLETGDFPTQQQLADIIDTMVYQQQQALDTAQAAFDALEDVPRMGHLTIASDGAPDFQEPLITKRREAGLTFTTAIVWIDPQFATYANIVYEVTVTVTFDVASADANYPAYIALADGNYSTTVAAINKTVNGCEFKFRARTHYVSGNVWTIDNVQVCFNAWP